MSQSHQSLNALSGTMLGVSTIIVGLRFYARSAQKAKCQADDWIMIPAYIFLVGLIAAMFSGTHYHTLGYPTPVLQSFQTPPQIAVAINRVVDVFAAAYFGCVKASALLFFRRIFSVAGNGSAFSITIWALLVITFLWAVLFMLLPIFQCHTNFAAAYSSVPIRSIYCTISHPYIEAQSFTDSVFDIIIVILPIPKIWALNMSFRRRLAVVFVFSTAAVALAASIAKTVIVFEIYGTNFTGDFALSSTQVYFMWILEAGFAMIAINLPTIVWLRNAEGPERMLASVRSFLSIGSSSSGGGGDGDGNVQPRKSESPRRPVEHGGTPGAGTPANGSRGGLPRQNFEPVPEKNVVYVSSVLSAGKGSNAASVPQRGIQITRDVDQAYTEA